MTEQGVFLCECRDMRAFAEDALATLFPDLSDDLHSIPFYQGSEEIQHAPIPSVSTPENQIKEYLAGLVRSKRRFAYWISWDSESGVIQSMTNLKDGRRVV